MREFALFPGGGHTIDTMLATEGLRGAGAPAGVTHSKRFDWDLSEAALQALVDIVPNDASTDRDVWIQVLHGIAGAGGAFEVFDAWSAKWPGYDAAATAKAWDTLDHSGIRSGGGNLRQIAERLVPDAFQQWKADWEVKERFADDEVVAAAAVGGSPSAKQLKYAQEVAARYGDVIRWNVDRGAWAVFGGGRWTQLEPGVKRAYQISVNMASVAGARSKGDADVMTAQFHNGVEDLCRQWPALQVREKDFDVDPWMLGTPGGVVDLRTGVMRPAVASDMISKLTAVAPNSGGCPRWMRFIDEVVQGDLGSKLFLQQWAGYCLTGSMREQMFLFVHGPGGNGKSVFADTLRLLWADYAVQPVSDLFVKKAHGVGHTSKLAMLAGARLCTVSEVPAGAQWDEGLLKDVTGGGAMTAGFKHKNEFTFQPLFKLMAMGNHQPTFPGGISPAIKRRFRMMEFGFVPRVVDRDLQDNLRKEWPGVLRWAIDGALAWAAGGGLVVPEAVSDATEAFFDEQDLPGRWLEERVEKSKGSKVQAADLFRDWIEWRNAQGNHTELDSQTTFGREMTERRALSKVRLGGAVLYQDIKLKSRAAASFDEN